MGLTALAWGLLELNVEEGKNLARSHQEKEKDATYRLDRPFHFQYKMRCPTALLESRISLVEEV